MAGQLHNGIVALLVDDGWETKGLKRTVVSLVKDEDAEDEGVEESSFPRPDAFRVVSEVRGDFLWTVVECAEVDVTHFSEDQLYRYSDIWGVVDSTASRVDIRLFRISAFLEKTEIDLCDLWNAFLRGCRNQTGINNG
jgi:hypothetical protein